MKSEGAGGRARTVGRQEKERPRASLAPADLVDALLDLKALEIVELRLVALELGVKLVVAADLAPVLGRLQSIIQP